MKTTIDIADRLLIRAKKLAALRNTTLKAVVEDALRAALRAESATARIAALCLQHSVTELWTADRDFSRFPALSTRNPVISGA